MRHTESAGEVARHEEQEHNLTPEKAWTLFFNSYLFSQGSTSLQDTIFKWLHAQYPDWRIAEEHMDHISHVGPKRIGRYISSQASGHKATPPEAIRNSVIQELAALQTTFAEPLPAVSDVLENYKKTLVEAIARESIERDYRFLIVNQRPWGPLPQTQEEIEAYGDEAENPPHTRGISHVMRYALGGGEAPTEEYTLMWTEVARWIREHIMTSNDLEMRGLREKLVRINEVHRKSQNAKLEDSEGGEA